MRRRATASARLPRATSSTWRSRCSPRSFSASSSRPRGWQTARIRWRARRRVRARVADPRISALLVEGPELVAGGEQLCAQRLGAARELGELLRLRGLDEVARIVGQPAEALVHLAEIRAERRALLAAVRIVGATGLLHQPVHLRRADAERLPAREERGERLGALPDLVRAGLHRLRLRLLAIPRRADRSDERLHELAEAGVARAKPLQRLRSATEVLLGEEAPAPELGRELVVPAELGLERGRGGAEARGVARPFAHEA